jgi:hypothetical protein
LGEDACSPSICRGNHFPASWSFSPNILFLDIFALVDFQVPVLQPSHENRGTPRCAPIRIAIPPMHLSAARQVDRLRHGQDLFECLGTLSIESLKHC